MAAPRHWVQTCSSMLPHLGAAQTGWWQEQQRYLGSARVHLTHCDTWVYPAAWIAAVLARSAQLTSGSIVAHRAMLAPDSMSS